MALAEYLVAAVLIEGRPVAEVAASVFELEGDPGGDRRAGRRAPQAARRRRAGRRGRSPSPHHLAVEGIRSPSTSTIRRILHAAGLVVAEPKKRPRSSLHRFSADQPNECWQSDFTHWHLADGTDIEILDWLDDHSRYLLSIAAFARVTGNDVVETFTNNVNEYGPPASTLTDNGSVYTSRFTGGRNAFEYLLHLLGIQQKNGRVNHPQTQGKIERFHQTLKK
ncbi:MAG TPA: DDE-type integrase/transposase/recombinase [Mycobacteriales bacterium]|nr:DDE-type integrase/transposase/recombinase [Mycobacteriales bacterium]